MTKGIYGLYLKILERAKAKKKQKKKRTEGACWLINNGAYESIDLTPSIVVITTCGQLCSYSFAFFHANEWNFIS